MYTLGKTEGAAEPGVIHRGNLVVVAFFFFRLQDLLRGELNAVRAGLRFFPPALN